jgi:spore germination cell wall hydrolase CwlJ-like protein
MDTPVTLLNRFLLALCIWREARGETPRGRRLVGATISNRVADPRWPKDYPGVILQPLQFSSFNANDPNAVQFPKVDDPAWPDCVAAADETFEDAAHPLTTANHYHVIGLNPAWRDDAKVVATEGHHVFYHL